MTAHRTTNPISATAPVADARGPTSAPGAAGGFVKLIRGDAVRELLHDPAAYALLSLIALRARWKNEGFSRHSLEPGQALVGDFHACGLSEQQYRGAKQRLARWRLATFQATNKGTVATLTGTSVFDINADPRNDPDNERATNEQRTSND